MASLVPPSAPGCCSWRFFSVWSRRSGTRWAMRLTNQECLLRYLFSFTKVLLLLFSFFFQNVFKIPALEFQQRATVTKGFFFFLKKFVLSWAIREGSVTPLTSCSFFYFFFYLFWLLLRKFNKGRNETLRFDADTFDWWSWWRPTLGPTGYFSSGLAP